MESARSGRPVGPILLAVLTALLATALAGCATMSGGVAGDVSRSMSDVASAAQSAALAFEQDLDDRSTAPVTGTTLDDMLDEVQTAATAVAELDVSTPAESELRDGATSSIRECTDSIGAARQVLASSGGDEGAAATAALQRLQAAADAASELSDELERFR